MKHSLTYHITLFVLRLKGIKKQFSQDPIDYKTVRRGDVHQPKAAFFRSERTSRFEVEGSTITEIKSKEDRRKLIVFIHGGAFVAGPGQHHWETLKAISEKTDTTIWMCDYPKAPEHTIDVITHNIDRVYEHACTQFLPEDIMLIGDSVGGNLVTTLVQRLVIAQQEVPSKIVLISPVMDASFDHPEIEKIEGKDPMLTVKGVVSAKRMAAGSRSLKDPIISPLYGSFEGFPSTVMYIAEHDICSPDQLLAAEKMREANVDVSVKIGEGMPHIWPLLPVMKEAKDSLSEIIKTLNKT